MPELPEVESLARAISEIAKGSTVSAIKFYRTNLREEIPVRAFTRSLKGKEILRVSRRSKYLLLHTIDSVGIFHLGMSGKILCLDSPIPRINHTHMVMSLSYHHGEPERYLHYIDPRRFGTISTSSLSALESHRYFQNLGPEPLEHEQLGRHLFEVSRNRSVAVKVFIMNAAVVVGVGNIYASEALFRAGIHPLCPCGHLTRNQYQRLATQIKSTLTDAIQAGGTTFRDFRDPNGGKGYFQVSLNVYGKQHQPCPRCREPILMSRIGQRSTFYCEGCQTKA